MLLYIRFQVHVQGVVLKTSKPISVSCVSSWVLPTSSIVEALSKIPKTKPHLVAHVDLLALLFTII